MTQATSKPWGPGEGPQRYIRELEAEIERLKIENDKMACQLEKIADFTVHPYSAAKAVLKELGRWKE